MRLSSLMPHLNKCAFGMAFDPVLDDCTPCNSIFCNNPANSNERQTDYVCVQCQDFFTNPARNDYSTKSQMSLLTTGRHSAQGAESSQLQLRIFSFIIVMIGTCFVVVVGLFVIFKLQALSKRSGLFASQKRSVFAEQSNQESAELLGRKLSQSSSAEGVAFCCTAKTSLKSLVTSFFCKVLTQSTSSHNRHQTASEYSSQSHEKPDHQSEETSIKDRKINDDHEIVDGRGCPQVSVVSKLGNNESTKKSVDKTNSCLPIMVSETADDHCAKKENAGLSFPTDSCPKKTTLCFGSETGAVVHSSEYPGDSLKIKLRLNVDDEVATDSSYLTDTRIYDGIDRVGTPSIDESSSAVSENLSTETSLKERLSAVGQNETTPDEKSTSCCETKAHHYKTEVSSTNNDSRAIDHVVDSKSADDLSVKRYDDDVGDNSDVLAAGRQATLGESPTLSRSPLAKCIADGKVLTDGDGEVPVVEQRDRAGDSFVVGDSLATSAGSMQLTELDLLSDEGKKAVEKLFDWLDEQQWAKEYYIRASDNKVVIGVADIKRNDAKDLIEGSAQLTSGIQYVVMESTLANNPYVPISDKFENDDAANERPQRRISLRSGVSIKVRHFSNEPKTSGDINGKHVEAASAGAVDAATSASSSPLITEMALFSGVLADSTTGNVFGLTVGHLFSGVNEVCLTANDEEIGSCVLNEVSFESTHIDVGLIKFHEMDCFEDENVVPDVQPPTACVDSKWTLQLAEPKVDSKGSIRVLVLTKNGVWKRGIIDEINGTYKLFYKQPDVVRLFKNTLRIRSCPEDDALQAVTDLGDSGGLVIGDPSQGSEGQSDKTRTLYVYGIVCGMDGNKTYTLAVNLYEALKRIRDNEKYADVFGSASGRLEFWKRELASVIMTDHSLEDSGFMSHLPKAL